ncbi:hypothetical protein FSARC_14548 [Fusarium sarcochroum]|uniref:Heterokaryon incompatibility domain-containing protein n=1 Tax=Fusarium sarcochroum TaxID=1208366 RepID=A0A8H4SSH2_9HYPO|nr:hypothetical protein FSARC_14548 [Fusarium sarcochroum]
MLLSTQPPTLLAWVHELDGMKTMLPAIEDMFGPLKPSPHYIRLLRIAAGGDGETIRCSLRAVNLDDNPTYTALSYAWRKHYTTIKSTAWMFWDMIQAGYRDEQMRWSSPNDEPVARPTKTIICNGGKLMIHANLYDGLLSFRRTRSTSEEYWMDAICINQGDTAEKTAQVMMMDRIYTSANNVAIWLGAALKDYDKYIPDLEALSRFPQGIYRHAHHQTFMRSTISFSLSHTSKLANDLTRRQWFSRIWVLQELFLSRRYVFLYGDHTISFGALHTAFTWVFQRRSITDELSRQDLISQAYMQPVYSPRLRKYQTTLKSRESISQGRRLTLREWLRVCQDRQSSDLRDCIFGGLSLIRPECKTIDHKRLQLEGDFRPRSDLQRPGTPPPLPKGLWSELHVDYEVSESEVFVNVAACLLSQYESHHFDLLSFAARCGDTKYVDEISEAKPINIPSLEGLPSWAPALGTWTTRVTSNLAAAAPEAGGGGVAFITGVLRSHQGIPSPNISKDGTKLFLNAVSLDVVQELLVTLDVTGYGKNSVATMAMLPSTAIWGITSLASFLEMITKLPHDYVMGKGTSFDAIANCVACFTPSSSPDKHFIQVETGMERRERPVTQSDRRASKWLCEVLSQQVHEWISKIRQDPHREDNESGKGIGKLECLVSAYTVVAAEYSDLPWTRIDSSLLNISGFEKTDIFQHLQHTWEEPQSDSPKPTDDTSWAKDETLRLAFEQYQKAFFYGMVWAIFFTTKDGLIGIGPSWLKPGDQIMVVLDAIVPYIFRTADDDVSFKIQRLEEIIADIRKDVMKLSRSKSKTELERAAALEIGTGRYQGQIDEMKQRIGMRSGWVLVGEAYVEGVMLGEVMEGPGGDSMERITLL